MVGNVVTREVSPLPRVVKLSPNLEGKILKRKIKRLTKSSIRKEQVPLMVSRNQFSVFLSFFRSFFLSFFFLSYLFWHSGINLQIYNIKVMCWANNRVLLLSKAYLKLVGRVLFMPHSVGSKHVYSCMWCNPTNGRVDFDEWLAYKTKLNSFGRMLFR